MEFKRDCKSFPGLYACEVMTAEGMEDCKDCMFYEPISKKILLIKLGALGDVVRTTPLVQAIKNKYGYNSHVTWLVKPGDNADVLKNNPPIDKILELNPINVSRVKQEKFNILFNLEIDPEATLIANEIKAEEKYGFYFHEDGHPQNFNKGAEFYLNRVFSNKISQESRKTYQEMMFEICELDYNKEPITLHNIDESYAENFKKENNLSKDDKIICINLGAGGRWPSKSWHQERILELLEKLKKTNYKILLRGGPEEKELLPEIISKARQKGIETITNYPKILNIPELISLINLCNIVVTGDTLVLHIAAALKKKTIALFLCTPDWEVEDYGFIKKLASPLLKDNFYTNFENEELMKSISAEEVFKYI